MKENLRIILLIIGVIAIIALFLHGVWSSRKEKSNLFGKKKRTNHRVESDNIPFNDDVDVLESEINILATDEDVGAVRVVRTAPSDSSVNSHCAKDATEQSVANPTNVVMPSPEVNGRDEPASKVQNPSNHLDESASSENEMTALTSNNQTEVQPTQVQSEPVEEFVIVLHVMGVNNNMLRGDLLLNSFLNSGLNYGNMNIFHRHLSTAASPVIFSVANMVKPGTFEPNQMLDFTTIGVTFFMVLPSAGDPIHNFKLMVQTVQRIAQDVGGQVYDDKRSILTQLKTESIKSAIHDWMDRTGQYA